jgi:hypothetical protein
MKPGFRPKNNHEDGICAPPLTAAGDARFMVRKLPACGLIPLV